MSDSRIRHEAIEQRLREALAARADTVEAGHLRPARLPTTPRLRHPPLRRTAVVLLGLAAVIACVLFAVANRTSHNPVPPAGTPPHSVNPPATPAPASPADPVQPPEGADPGQGPDPASPATTTGR